MIINSDKDSEGKASQLAEEVSSMIDSIKVVKGEAYADAVTSLFTIQNLTAILFIENVHLKDTLGKSNDIMGFPPETFMQILVQNMSGITVGIAANFVGDYEGKEEYQARLEAKSMEMIKDISMLTDKQDEYNFTNKGQRNET